MPAHCPGVPGSSGEGWADPRPHREALGILAEGGWTRDLTCGQQALGRFTVDLSGVLGLRWLKAHVGNALKLTILK